MQVEEKSNDITAISRLLELLELKGCIVTIHAKGCQKEIAQGILGRGTVYVLAVKQNLPCSIYSGWGSRHSINSILCNCLYTLYLRNL